MTNNIKQKTEDKINNVLEKVRPYIQMHGGNVKLIGIKNKVAHLEINGTCTHCSLANLTYNKIIGSLLKEGVPTIKSINLFFNKKQNGKSKRICS